MTIRFTIHYHTYPGQELLFCGSQETTAWLRDEQAKPMTYRSGGYWSLDLPVRQKGVFVYRYLVRENGRITRREWGRHQLTLTSLTEQFAEVLDTWQTEPAKSAGTAIPVFSLRSDKDWGIGDFGDLFPMIDWLEQSGQKILQLLPVQDTTNSFSWYDSYPYSIISVFALHPIYAAPSLLPALEDRDKAASFEERAKQLNLSESVKYEEVLSLKWEYFRLLFDQEQGKIIQSVDYKRFLKENSHWLRPYAAYCYLLRKLNNPDPKAWGEYSNYDSESISRLCDPRQSWHKDIAIHYYIQFQLHCQLEQVHDYAAQKGILLKGDIPIGVNRFSVEAWQHKNLFRLDLQTGAPPDEFSDQGQNWGFPVYDWNEMHRWQYKWWRKRLQHMAKYFDAYRIDHILGFFRIWSIPTDSTSGLLGYFKPALPYTPKEIRAFGLDFDRQTMCKPLVDEVLLGEYPGLEIFSYLRSPGNQKRHSSKKESPAPGSKPDQTGNHQRYLLKEELDTQSKVRNYFGDSTQKEISRLREALCRMCTEVLFIEDKDKAGRYHPRILGNQTAAYRCLSEKQQKAFDRLYEHFYFERHNEFWKEQAMRSLPELLSSSSMIACGEDLGMIPASVPEVMEQLCMLSLELERMPKTFGVEFEALDRIPYLSVCTTSTHDMSPLRAWWEENPLQAGRYWQSVLHEQSDAPLECSADLAYRILQHHLSSNAMWVILPWQDWLALHNDLRKTRAETERINVPENSKHRWDYRIHINIEDFLNSTTLNTTIRRMIADSGR